jgi:hypothetical protein
LNKVVWNLVIVICAALAIAAPIGVLSVTHSEPAEGSVRGWYFRIRAWESWQRYAVYRVLGVPMFKRALLYWYDQVMYWAQRSMGHWIFRRKELGHVAWRRAAGQHLATNVDRAGAMAFAHLKSQQLELIHLFCVLPLIPIILLLWCSSHYLPGSIIALVTLVTNAYPVLLQRYNRSRIETIICRKGG